MQLSRRKKHLEKNVNIIITDRGSTHQHNLTKRN